MGLFWILYLRAGCYVFIRMDDGLKKLKMRLPAVVLLAATLLFWGFYDRYKVVGGILLDSPTLAESTLVRGNSTETNGRFVLSVGADKKMARVNFRMPAATDFKMIRVKGRIKVDGVVAGKYEWRSARLLLLQYDANNKWIPGEHGLVAESGTKDWAYHEDVFNVMDSAVHVDVVLQHSGLAGTASFDSIQAEAVELRSSFYGFQGVFALLWLGMGFLYYKRCRLHRRRLHLLILLNTIAILFGTLMPTVVIQTVSDGFKERVAAVMEKRLEEHRESLPAETVPQKAGDALAKESKRIDQFKETVDSAHVAGHFVLFASLCFLVYLSAYLEKQAPAYYFKVAFDILLFAAITEALQNLTLDRTAGIGDWETDVYGLATGLAVFLVVRFCKGLAGRKESLGV